MAGNPPGSVVTPRHLAQIDVVRLLTFTAVIAVHSVDFTQSMTSTGAAAVIMLLQFGREVFFALTGLVLMYSAARRPLRTAAFWRRRLLLIVVPYLTWSAIYEIYGMATSSRPAMTVNSLVTDLLSGGAEYHLYFLLVTLQLYLVFPLLARFVRRTAARPLAVLAVVGGLNALWLGLLQYMHAPHGWLSFFWTRGYELLPTYSVYVLLGCYAAVHLDRVEAAVRRHGRGLIAAAIALAAVGELAFVAQLGSRPPRSAGTVLQPAMLLVSLAALVATAVAGSRWARGRRRGSTAMSEASDISFGVYLAHPLVLDIVLRHGLASGTGTLSAVPRVVIAMACTIAGSATIAWVARRTRVSLALTGRPRRRSAEARPARRSLRNISCGAPGVHKFRDESDPMSLTMTQTAPGPLTGATSVRDLLVFRVATAPDVEAFIIGATGESVSWSAIGDAVRTWAANRHALCRRGESRVGLVLGEPLATATAFLAGMATDVTIAPLDPAAPEQQLLKRARTLGLTAVVTDGGDAALNAALARSGLDVWTWRGGRLEPFLVVVPDPPPPSSVDRPRHGDHSTGDVALLMCTSGTTGNPKVIPLSEDQLLRVASAVAAHHDLRPDDRGYSPLPLFHINGLVVGLLATLVSGGSLVIDRRFSVRQFWATVQEHRVTWLNLVPAVIGLLATAELPPDGVGGGVRFARSASAPLPAAARDGFEQRTGIGVIETYGMTEAASQITANPLAPEDRRPGSVGRPVGVELRVVDRDGRPVSPVEVGEVQLRGPTVITHYLEPPGTWPRRRPATTADGWLPTGDLGRTDSDGFLYLAARVDDVINRGGEKIYPGEIEEVLLGNPRVRAAAVVAQEHAVTGQEPVAFVLAGPDLENRGGLEADLLRRCEQSLSPFMRPARIIVTDAWPQGPTGKVRRTELRAQLARCGVRPGGVPHHPSIAPQVEIGEHHADDLA